MAGSVRIPEGLDGNTTKVLDDHREQRTPIVRSQKLDIPNASKSVMVSAHTSFKPLPDAD
jgi:hypothetical protein